MLVLSPVAEEGVSVPCTVSCGEEAGIDAAVIESVIGAVESWEVATDGGVESCDEGEEAGGGLC
jgi:hypothetical protein